MVQIIKQLVDVLPHGNFQLHAQIVRKQLCQFVIKTDGFTVDIVVNKRGGEGTDAQLPPLLNGGDTVFGLAEPGDRRPEGHCQQQRNNADEQIINL